MRFCLERVVHLPGNHHVLHTSALPPTHTHTLTHTLTPLTRRSTTFDGFLNPIVLGFFGIAKPLRAGAMVEALIPHPTPSLIPHLTPFTYALLAGGGDRLRMVPIPVLWEGGEGVS